MPSVRKAFKEQFPYCRLIIIEANQDEVSSLIESGKCSFGIVQMKNGFPLSISHETIGTDHVLCVCSKDYVLRNKETPLTLKSLAKEDLILTSKGTGIRSSLDKLAAEENVELSPIWTCLSGDNALSFAEQGFGVAVLSETFTRESRMKGKTYIHSNHICHKQNIPYDLEKGSDYFSRRKLLDGIVYRRVE